MFRLDALFEQFDILLCDAATKQSRYARWLLAYSGGLDSSVLLYCLCEYAKQANYCTPDIIALHINHQIHTDARQWERHCARMADTYAIGFFSERIELDKSRSIETQARTLRYAVLEKYARQGDCVLMAHHADDQAETVLQRLLRGAGVQGLAGMPALRTLPRSKAILLRPLLNTPRCELEHIAAHYNLTYCDDPSNGDATIQRNFLRHSIFPRLQTQWPDAKQQLLRAAKHVDEAGLLLNEFAEQDATFVGVYSNRWGELVLSGERMRDLSVRRQKNMLYYMLKQMSALQSLALIIDRDAIVRFLTTYAAQDMYIDDVYLLRLEWRQWQGNAYLHAFVCRREYVQKNYFPLTKQHIEHAASNTYSSLNTRRLTFDLSAFDAGFLSISYCANDAHVLDKHKLFIAFRQGGERCHPRARQHATTLKKLFQEYGVPWWYRDRVPLIFVDGTLYAVADLWREKSIEYLDLDIRWLPYIKANTIA